jgi:hypothetical protein
MSFVCARAIVIIDSELHGSPSELSDPPSEIYYIILLNRRTGTSKALNQVEPGLPLSFFLSLFLTDPPSEIYTIKPT